MTKEILAAFASAVALFVIGCDTKPDVIVDSPAPETSSESDSEATTTDATTATTEEESPADVPDEERGLDDEPLPEGLSMTPDRVLLEALPPIEDLPSLSTETTIDEKTKFPYAKVGDFAIRDGVYVFRMVSTDGMRELIMTVETQANGFLVRRGDRTKLRFVVDGDKTTFASEPGSGEIAGRGTAAGDDWAKGSFRVKNDDGTTSEGTFELRKLYDLKAPRSTKPAPAVETPTPGAEEATPAAPAEAPAAQAQGPASEKSAPTAEVPED